MDCPDEFVLAPSSVDELLALPNSGKYKIISLSLGEEWGDCTALVSFSLSELTPIKISVSGEDAEVVRVYENLHREVSVASITYRPKILGLLFEVPVVFLRPNRGVDTINNRLLPSA